MKDDPGRLHDRDAKCGAQNANRAESALSRFRNWMNRNSWIVRDLLIAFFLAMTTKGPIES